MFLKSNEFIINSKNSKTESNHNNKTGHYCFAKENYLPKLKKKTLKKLKTKAVSLLNI